MGEKIGINRYADRTIPMDEALILTAVDISGRDYLGYALNIPSYRVGSFDTELCEEFFKAFVREARICIHIRQLCGTNSHHIIECAFKSVAVALSAATAKNERFKDEIPSTKGVI